MKKSIQIIATAFAILLGNAGFSQNDTMYVNYGGNVTIAIPTSQIDSLTFYRPNITTSITDADGNVYTSVTIGTQEWMVENLRTTKYSDGATIPNITDDTEWSNDTIGAWCNLNNDSQYDSTYGKLYNWYAVETEKLCPTGWHVPTNEEWIALTDYLAADGHQNKEGVALKATSGWYDYFGMSNGIGTDNYGWLGLSGGNRYHNGTFNSIGEQGFWWSSTKVYPLYYPVPETKRWTYMLTESADYLYHEDSDREYGFSVRCIKD